MRVQPPALPAQLKRGLAPLYHLFGPETLLVEEAADTIRRAARAQDFTERVRYTVEPGFNWNQVFVSSQSMSLFATKKLIEVRMPTGKPGAAGDKALLQYAQDSHNTDTILLLLSGGDRIPHAEIR